MPRRLPVRPAKVFGNFFVLIVLCLMSTVYYTFVFVIYGPRAEKDPKILALLIVYNFIFLMLVWSFFQTMTTDPGQVPVFWGFHLGDNENKRRRYCLMCNVFKPERCHHCSACNRCVLNMDHHCPWVNNCVGFWNRKYFLLLLLYVLIGTYMTVVFAAYDFYEAIKWGINNKMIGSNDPNLSRNIFVMVGYTLNGTVAGLMTVFLKFHLKLATENKTTIENLDKMGKPFQSVYDVGARANWRQIFGTNPWLYPFPIFCGSGKPVGDGIYWPTIQSQQELAQRQSQQTQERAAQSQVVGNRSQQQQQNRGGNVQMIGAQQSNIIMMNQQDPNQNFAGNSKQDLNQRIFQNQGRAFQLQQQLQIQQQQQLQKMQQQQMQYRGGAGGAGAGAGAGGASGTGSNANRPGQKHSSQVNPKRRRAPGQESADGQYNPSNQSAANSINNRRGSNNPSVQNSQNAAAQR